MCKRLQGRGGADTRPLSPTSVRTVSQAPCWVLYKYGPHDNLLGRWGYPILQMGTPRLSGQMNHPCIMWLKFEAVSGTQNSGKGFQELGCWRDGESQAPGLRGHLPSCTVCGNEILRDPGHLPRFPGKTFQLLPCPSSQLLVQQPHLQQPSQGAPVGG